MRPQLSPVLTYRTQPEVDAHSRRVAALAVEIATRLRLPQEAQEAVEQTAFIHHYPPLLLESSSLDRLMTDVRGKGWWIGLNAEVLAERVPSEVKAAVRAMYSGSTGEERDRYEIIAEIVEIANIVTELLEFAPYEYRTMEQVLDDVRAMSQEEFMLPEIVLGLTSLPRARREELLDIVYRLPVFPTPALRALEPAADDGISFAQLHELASSDQGLATSLLQVANSDLYAPSQHIVTVRQAIGYIGMKAARKILMAAVLRPLFASPKLRELWKHSLQMAQLCERLAVICGTVDPKLAFLAGLAHDVGRLPMERLTGEVGAARARLLDRGCEPIFVEKIVCRFDHGELGGDILQGWNFPDEIALGVRYHHQPEQTDSVLAAILYLAEYWCATEEDLPSAARLKKALNRTGLTIELIESADQRSGLLDSLINAA